MTTHIRKSSGMLMAGVGCLFGVWSVVALIGALNRLDWQVTELVRQYLVASGMIQQIHTIVDFYTHIKGIEYLICVAFFVAFPVFFRYVDKRQAGLPTLVDSDKSKL